jgi:alpha-ribazole phosphatase
MTPRILLVRHTRVAAEGLCYGRAEVPLAATFPTEAEAVRAALPWAPRAVWSSPAQRCRRLAAAISGADPVLDERLAEVSMGAWEGRPWEALRGPEVDAWMADPWRVRPPGGETAGEFLARVGAFRRGLLETAEAGTVVVTHAGVVRAWRSLAQGRPLPEVFAEPVPFGALFEAR